MATKSKPLSLPQCDRPPAGAMSIRQALKRWGYAHASKSAIRRLIQEGRVKAVEVPALNPAEKVIYVLDQPKPERLPPSGGRPPKDPGKKKGR